jgi:hypothetical protein
LASLAKEKIGQIAKCRWSFWQGAAHIRAASAPDCVWARSEITPPR